MPIIPLHRGAPRAGKRTQQTLEQLLVLVARNDQRAFELLYDRVAPQVFGLIRRVVRDPAQSEEVMQEVFTELWRTASRFDPARGSALTWLMTTTHRRAVDRVRSAHSSVVRDDLAARRDEEQPFDQVAEHVESRLERERVRRALAGLTELQRQAVTLAYYNGYTYREVAEVLGVPLGTVKTRLRDGLIRLRDTLEVEA